MHTHTHACVDTHTHTHTQICISYALHEGRAVIAKTVNPDRVKENLKSTALSLDAADIEKLRSVNREERNIKGDFIFRRGETEAQFWDTEEDERYVL